VRREPRIFSFQRVRRKGRTKAAQLSFSIRRMRRSFSFCALSQSRSVTVSISGYRVLSLTVFRPDERRKAHNEPLVRSLDWPRYPGRYSPAQREAERVGRGIWAGSYVEPWVFRACVKEPEASSIARASRALEHFERGRTEEMCNFLFDPHQSGCDRCAFRLVNRHVGNLPPMPGVFLDHPAPVVRKLGGDREMTIMRKDLDVDLFQIRCSGRVQRRPIHVEHRTVARAIPTNFKAVPVQMTSDMSTGRRTEMHGPVAVAIGRQLLEPLP
jgi:hypothetical protein